MFTHCPHCHTTFRIHPRQLAQARGQVRCGVCSYCFNALDTLSEQSTPPKPEPSTPASEATETAPPAEMKAPASLEMEPIPAAEVEISSEPAPGGKAGFPSTAPPEEPEEAPMTALPLSARPNDALSNLGTIAMEPRPVPASTPEAETEPAPGPLKTALWAAVNLVLILTLLGQYTYFNRDELAQHPQLRPWLTQLCSVLACDTPLRREVSRITLTKRVVASHPDRPNALLIDATLVNQADFPQPYPLLELRFSDLNNQLLAGRRFRPREYLAAGTAINAGMPPHQPVHIVLEIVDPGKDAVSFLFDLL